MERSGLERDKGGNQLLKLHNSLDFFFFTVLVYCYLRVIFDSKVFLVTTAPVHQCMSQHTSLRAESVREAAAAQFHSC